MSDAVEFRHLKYIVAVAETGNFTRAAQWLFVAQPSLSKQIREIEEAIGFRIFRRTPDGVFPTPVGQLVVDYAITALHGRHHVLQMAKEVFLGNVPPLRMGFSSFVNPRHLQTFRSSYERHFPKCVLQLTGGDAARIIQRVERGDLNCAIVTLPVVGDQWKIIQLASSALLACMRADDPLAERTTVTVSDVASRLTIFRDPEGHPSAHARLTQMFSEAGMKLRISNSAASPHDIQLLVRDGFGIALISQDALLEPQLTTRHIDGISWTSDTAFVYQVAAPHPALSFIEKYVLRAVNAEKPRAVRSERPQQAFAFDMPA